MLFGRRRIVSKKPLPDGFEGAMKSLRRQDHEGRKLWSRSRRSWPPKRRCILQCVSPRRARWSWPGACNATKRKSGACWIRDTPRNWPASNPPWRRWVSDWWWGYRRREGASEADVMEIDLIPPDRRGASKTACPTSERPELEEPRQNESQNKS